MPLNKSLARLGPAGRAGPQPAADPQLYQPVARGNPPGPGLSFQSSALLTSLPVVCMGLVALVGIRVEAQLGERRGIALGLMMILLACLARWLLGQAPALLATALLGGPGWR
jgi:MFS transporter, CP family, cyanate transporter